VRWYQKSADRYNQDEEFALGRMYEFGIAVPRSRATSMAWFQKPGAQGHSQTANFARWLSDPANNIGFRNQQEQTPVISGKLRFGARRDDPEGIRINSGEGLSWLNESRQRTGHEAMTVCRNAGGTNCQSPGEPPQ
jgi:TPR repeat protein